MSVQYIYYLYIFIILLLLLSETHIYKICILFLVTSLITSFNNLLHRLRSYSIFRSTGEIDSTRVPNGGLH